MNNRVTNKFLENLIDGTRGSLTFAVNLIAQILSHRQQSIGTAPAGTSATLSALPITGTPTGTTTYDVTGQANASAATAADSLTFQLVRNPGLGEVLIGAPVQATADANGKANATLEVTEQAVPVTAQIYAVRVTDNTGGHTVALSSSVIRVQESF